MADSLLDQLKALVTPEIVARVGGALGESEENVEKGFGAAAPALLSGLVSRASEGQGAERILSLVNDTDNDGSVLSNTESLLSDTVATTPLHGLGQTLMGGLFSGKAESVAEGIAEESGIQKGSALKILGFLSPLLLGLLGKNLGPGAPPASLLGLVTAQKESVLSAISGGMTEKLGGIVNLGALSGAPVAAAATAASSIVGGLGSLAVSATPVVPEPVIEAPVTPVVEPPVIEEPVAVEEPPVVETPVFEPVEATVEPAVESVEEVAPVSFSVPEVPEEPVEVVEEVIPAVELPEPTVPDEVSIAVPEEVVELPEPVAVSIEEPYEIPVEVVAEATEVEPIAEPIEEVIAEAIDTSDAVAPVIFEPVEETEAIPDAAEVGEILPEAETVVALDTAEEPELPVVVDTVEAVEDAFPVVAEEPETVFIEEPVVAVPDAAEPYEPIVEPVIDEPTDVVAEAIVPEAVVPEETVPDGVVSEGVVIEAEPVEVATEPVAAVEEAVSTAREAINDASDHLVGNANVMVKPEPGPGLPKFAIPVVAIIVLGGIAYYFVKGRKPATPPVATNATPAPTNASPAPDATPANTDSTPAPTGDDARPEATAELALPDGKTLKVVPGGTEAKLVAFLQDASKPVEENTWFNFDRLNFEFGKGSLKPESRPQIENIVAVLNAFPNVNVKIGGYTDNSGTKDGNLQLSGSRATSVMKAITGRKIAENRIEAEGYGDQHPECAANDTEDCKKKNRRVAIRVTKK